MFEAADASLELLMRQATGWAQDYFRVEGYRATTYHRAPVAGQRQAGHRHRGHREGLGRRRAAHRGGRGQRPGQRPRPRAAAACSWARTRSSPTSTSPTTGCASSTPRPTPTPSCACSSTPPTATGRGPPSACPPTSSRRRWQALTDALVWGLLHSEPVGSAAMAAPEHVPVDRTKPVRAYESPPRRPESWLPTGPARSSTSGQPRGDGSATRAPTRATR